MNNFTSYFLNSKKFQNYLEDINNNNFPVSLSGLTDLAKVHFSFSTSFLAKKPLLIITYNEIIAKNIARGLSFFNTNVMYFPKKEIVSYDIETESREILNQRVKVLESIIKGENPIIVTTIEAITQKMIKKSDFEKHSIEFNLNSEYNLEDIKEELVKLGYENCKSIEGKGQFSIRGGIIDISPVDIDEGIRIELWGDEVDSIRLFDIETQRSIKNIEKTVIYPCSEFLGLEPIDKIIKNDKILPNDKEAIQNGNYHNKMQKYFDVFYKKSASFLEYIGEDYLVFIDEAIKIKQRLENILADNELLIESLIEKQKYVSDGLKNNLKYEEYLSLIENKNVIYLEKLDNKYVDKQNMHAKKKRIQLQL